MVRAKTDRRERTAQGRSGAAKPKADRKPVKDTGAQVLDSTKLKALYAAMLKCRMLEEKLRHLAQQGKVPGDSVAPAGHEAVIVGTAMHLQPEDFIVPSRSVFLATHVQGAPLEQIFKQLSGSRALPEMPLAEQLTAGACAALSFKLQRRRNVALAIVDGDAASPGFWHEAVSFASMHLLPVVFVICASSVEPELRDQAHEFGLPGITVDGTDVVAVFRVAQESLRRARQGHGPCLIECKIDHADDSGPQIGPLTDPLLFMEAYLKKRRLWSGGQRQSLMRQTTKELKEASAAALTKPVPR